MKRPAFCLAVLASLSPFLLRCQEAPPAPPPTPETPFPGGVTVALDPGHGGRHTGFVGPSGLCEKDVNLRVSLELRRLLQSWGARVVMTRTADTDLSEDPTQDANARIDLVNREHPTLCLALHAGGNPKRPSARGFQVRVVKTTDSTEDQNRALSRLIRSELSQVWGPQDLGTRYESLARGQSSLNCPAALVEFETITNPSVEAQLKERTLPPRVAQALGKAIRRWLKGEKE